MNVVVHNVTITSGGATSAASQDIGNMTLLGVRTPATYDGTTMTFTCCDTAGGTYDTVYRDDGTAYTVTLAASRYTAVDYTKFLGARFLRVVAGTNQATTDTIVTLYLGAFS
jgi:hypothetical protein